MVVNQACSFIPVAGLIDRSGSVGAFPDFFYKELSVIGLGFGF